MPESLNVLFQKQLNRIKYVCLLRHFSIVTSNSNNFGWALKWSVSVCAASGQLRRIKNSSLLTFLQISHHHERELAKFQHKTLIGFLKYFKNLQTIFCQLHALLNEMLKNADFYK